MEDVSQWRGTALMPTIARKRTTSDVLKRKLKTTPDWLLSQWTPTGIVFSAWSNEYEARVRDRDRLNQTVLIEAARLGVLMQRLPTLDELFYKTETRLRAKVDPSHNLKLSKEGGRMTTSIQRNNFRLATQFLEFSLKVAVHLHDCCWFRLDRFFPLFYSDELGAPSVKFLLPKFTTMELPSVTVSPTDAFVGQVLFRVVAGVSFGDCLKSFTLCRKKWPTQTYGGFVDFPELAFNDRAPMFFNFDLEFLKQNVDALKRGMVAFSLERKHTMAVEQLFSVGDFVLAKRWFAIIGQFVFSPAFESSLATMTKRVNELTEILQSLKPNVYLGDLLDIFCEKAFLRQ